MELEDNFNFINKIQIKSNLFDYFLAPTLKWSLIV